MGTPGTDRPGPGDSNAPCAERHLRPWQPHHHLWGTEVFGGERNRVVWCRAWRLPCRGIHRRRENIHGGNQHHPATTYPHSPPLSLSLCLCVCCVNTCACVYLFRACSIFFSLDMLESTSWDAHINSRTHAHTRRIEHTDTHTRLRAQPQARAQKH